MSSHWTRREFLRQAALAGAAATALGRFSGEMPGAARSPSEKLNIGIIGTGGRGGENMKAVSGENIVALCDVDQNHLDAAAARFPAARKYSDFRELLEKERGLDAVVVSTPDHCHAPASVMAMKLGLHVYCEKPLTHSVYEARVVAQTAAEKKVVTQMGTQTSSDENNFRIVELIQSGAIGEVREVHVWTDRPIWPQGEDRPAGEDPVPKHLDWDLWIGPAPFRPYKATYPSGRFRGQPVYHPFAWRGWWDFGTGALGDIAPHAMNVVFWALKLGPPASVEAECSGMKPESFPDWSIIRFDFPARPLMPPVRVIWYDGHKLPPAELFEGRKPGDNGCLFVGSKGRLWSEGLRLLPDKEFVDFRPPAPTLPRRPEVHQDWLAAIRKGTQPGCHFGYSGPMTEAYLLGNIALRLGRRIEWDPVKSEVTNCPEANQYLKREYRKGWTL
ncbi:MAG: Gfo/Idh/MocA family protein [Thermoguttaceae bacterium]